MACSRWWMTFALAGTMLLAACGGDADDGSARDASPGIPPTSSSAATGPPTIDVSVAGLPTARTTMVAGSPSARSPVAVGDPYAQTIDWQPCSNFQCATVTVPTDYDDPSSGTTSIALLKSEATGTRQGSLFINPGGPGGSGVSFAPFFASLAPAELTEVYDIIGFDPRGVGQSDPLICLDTAGLDAIYAADPDPDTPEEEQQVQDLTTGWGEGCLRTNPHLAAHVTTVETAKDLDVLRALVGDEMLNYYGASYGTFLGTTYAALFPDKVGRMVLDGAIDPSLSFAELALAQAGGFQTALDAYIADCLASGSCPLGASQGEIATTIIDLLAQLDSQPMPTDDPDRPLSEFLAFYGIVSPLYSPGRWPDLTAALQAAASGDGSALLEQADLYIGRTPDGYASNQMQAQTAINCLDTPLKPAGTTPSEDQFTQASPVFGPIFYAYVTEYGCEFWPIEPMVEAPDYSAPGAAPILVIGTTRDPATPYAGAQKLAGLLQSGVLLTRDGDGHLGYNRGNTCIDEAVDAYLIDGIVPEDGTECADDVPTSRTSPVFAFAYVIAA